jgi:hypothetical protein
VRPVHAQLLLAPIIRQAIAVLKAILTGEEALLIFTLYASDLWPAHHARDIARAAAAHVIKLDLAPIRYLIITVTFSALTLAEARVCVALHTGRTALVTAAKALNRDALWWGILRVKGGALLQGDVCVRFIDLCVIVWGVIGGDLGVTAGRLGVVERALGVVGGGLSVTRGALGIGHASEWVARDVFKGLATPCDERCHRASGVDQQRALSLEGLMWIGHGLSTLGVPRGSCSMRDD